MTPQAVRDNYARRPTRKNDVSATGTETSDEKQRQAVEDTSHLTWASRVEEKILALFSLLREEAPSVRRHIHPNRFYNRC